MPFLFNLTHERCTCKLLSSTGDAMGRLLLGANGVWRDLTDLFADLAVGRLDVDLGQLLIVGAPTQGDTVGAGFDKVIRGREADRPGKVREDDGHVHLEEHDGVALHG
jgi:hypothetical protein